MTTNAGPDYVHGALRPAPPPGYAWLDADLCVNVAHVLAVQAVHPATNTTPPTPPRTRVLVGAAQSFIIGAAMPDVLALIDRAQLRGPAN